MLGNDDEESGIVAKQSQRNGSHLNFLFAKGRSMLGKDDEESGIVAK